KIKLKTMELKDIGEFGLIKRLTKNEIKKSLQSFKIFKIMLTNFNPTFIRLNLYLYRLLKGDKK
ncbi:unnamed protein product, partial [marine sediment metagenome]